MGFSTGCSFEPPALQPATTATIKMANTNARLATKTDFLQLMIQPLIPGFTERAGPRTTGPSLKTLLPLLQRLQERNQLVFLRGAQRTVVVDNSRSFAPIPQNRLVPGKRKQIMHQ